MSYMVSAQDSGALTFNESDLVASVMQNIRILLSTRRGSVPMYRDFGLPMKFIDKPENVAKTLIAAEIEDAIREFEPRAEIKNIVFAIDESAPGRLVPTLEVEILEEP